MTDVAYLLLDDAGTCQWRDCEALCLMPETKSAPDIRERVSVKSCNQSTFMTLERRLLSVLRVRLGSLTDRVVRDDDGKLVIAYSASPDASGTRYGVPVVTRSHTMFTVEPVAENRVLVEYCQWAVPPPVLGMTSRRIGNREAKKDVQKTLRSMEKALRERQPAMSSDSPYLPCAEVHAPICPAE